jgi:carboxymethylenebutenolidase
MTDDMTARTVTISGHGGDEIEAYFGEPLGDGPFGGVVVIHHLPGYDRSSKEIVRRFAAQGYLAVMPNLYSREARGSSSDDAAAAVRAVGGVPDERLVGEVAGAVSFLKSRPAANGKAGCIGYCSGGRQTFLSACTLPLDAAVDCYGGLVVGTPNPERPNMVPLLHLTKDLSCPLLGLFGADDQFPGPAQVAELESALKEHGKTYEFHSYPGAGHAFFDVDRPSYRVDAAADGWKRVWEFFGRHLSA